MRSVPSLYPAQAEGVERFRQSGGRYLFCYGTGVGKTPTAIVAMTRYLASLGHKNPKILVVCPAIVRRHWVREFERWAGLEAHPIEMGPDRTTGSKAALAARDLAYRAHIQVVSYDLSMKVRAQGWHGVILDEVHHLADYGSNQSRTARSLMAANPGVPTLGLSATLIPTKIHQLWHPLHLLWPKDWGRAPRTGSIPWQFVAQWQHILDDGYGRYPGGALEHRLNELKARLSQVSHRLTREDILAHLPPVDARPLELPGHAFGRELRMANRERPEVSAAKSWYGELPQDIHHSVILCYHREVAADITRAIRTLLPQGHLLITLTGSVSTADRIRQLDAAEAAVGACVIATSESIAEGIRLMWAQRVLYAEWRKSPKQVIQTLGRFESVGDERRPAIDVLCDESTRDKAHVLMQRIQDINGIMEAGSTERQMNEVFKPKAMTDEAFALATQAMFAQRATALDPDWVEADEEFIDG